MASNVYELAFCLGLSSISIKCVFASLKIKVRARERRKKKHFSQGRIFSNVC